MYTYELFSGEKSFVPAGEKPQHGDPDLVMSFNRPGDTEWNEKMWLCFDIRVAQFSDARVFIRFYDADGRMLEVRYELLPCVKVHYRFQLDELWNRRHFLPVFPGSYKAGLTGLPMDPADVKRFEIAVTPGKDFESAVLYRVWISDEHPGGIEPEAPVIDSMGQLIGYEWPGKTHSFEEMKARLEKEYEEAKKPLSPLPGRDRFGGYTALKFDATGWFRTQFDGRRWWLVDPDGGAFFSNGMAYGTRMGEFGWYTGMEKFYADAPTPDDPAFKDAFTQPKYIAEYVKRHGTTERSDDYMYNPARGNMIRVFGKNWWEAWRAIATKRFRDWGINTTGVGIVNFIDERLEDFLRISKIPYAVTLKRFPVTKSFIFRDFPDVFSDEYAANSETFARSELAPMADDPYLIGYFMHNEPEWMFQRDCNVAWELLVRPEPFESRKHMAGWLYGRYGMIEALNGEWGTAFESFDDLLRPVPRQTKISEAGMAVLAEYEQILIDRFSHVPLAACRKVDPHHLCLGMRYGSMNEKILRSCMAYDVFSFNCYSKDPSVKLNGGKIAGKPMIIGEWHFGGPDTGLRRTALVSAASQEERGKAYRRYLENVAADPYCVGAHYFEYNNQTLMGRFDGEHMAHGIIDCTNKPYPYMVQAMETCRDELFDVLTGKKAPYDADIVYQDKNW